MRNSSDVMKQVAEVETVNGKIRMMQQMGRVFLDRDEVLFLTKIPLEYLISEVKARGYEIVPKEKVDQSLDLFDFLDLAIKKLANREFKFIELQELIVKRAVQVFRMQNKASEALGISRRMIHYYYHTINNKQLCAENLE